MSTQAQLILTHGITDLQILLQDNNGQCWRAYPEKITVRLFHTWLLKHVQEATVIELPTKLSERKAEISFKWKEDTFTNCSNQPLQPKCDAQGRLQLVLPKISPSLTKWLAQQVADTSQPENSALQGVLVFSTDRKTDKQEPIATFTFLKQWLIQKGVSEANIEEAVYLCDKETVEGESGAIDPVISQRIETKIARFYKRDTRPLLIIASMGGLPQIKPLLAEIGVMLAGGNVCNLFKTENGMMGILPRTPIDAVRVRRQCLEQVRRGALLDAWAMAAPFHCDPQAKSWVRPLEQAAQLINGNPVKDQGVLPALECIIKHAADAACLLVAIRVETALQSERWFEAINGSLTFFDAAFQDGLRAWAKTNQAECDVRGRIMRFQKEPEIIDKLIDSGSLKKEDYSYKVDIAQNKAKNAWCAAFNNKSLNQLKQVISNEIKPFKKPSDYRNFNTHGVLDQKEIDEARECFIRANLWFNHNSQSTNDLQPGQHFLSQPLVENVIGSFIGQGVSPVGLYKQLLTQLENRLIDPKCD